MSDVSARFELRDGSRRRRDSAAVGRLTVPARLPSRGVALSGPDTWLSTHVLDTERGQPAVGVPVALSRWIDGELVLVARGETDGDGRIGRLAESLAEGIYQLAFDVAAYQRRHNREAPFFQRVVVEFRALDDEPRHYHVPLLLAPYGATVYRGS